MRKLRFLFIKLTVITPGKDGVPLPKNIEGAGTIYPALQTKALPASIPGKELVAELNEMFQHFDDIVAELGIEKIQTIGDAYVAACGLPKADADHAILCVQAGKQMIAYLDQRNKDSSIKWEIRVGIHSGPITAGVVGKRKFAYDLFGDSINIAARIESAGAAGKINVSAYTHKLIKHQFPCDYRGKINAKGKGDLDMYFVVD